MIFFPPELGYFALERLEQREVEKLSMLLTFPVDCSTSGRGGGEGGRKTVADLGKGELFISVLNTPGMRLSRTKGGLIPLFPDSGLFSAQFENSSLASKPASHLATPVEPGPRRRWQGRLSPRTAPLSSPPGRPSGEASRSPLAVLRPCESSMEPPVTRGLSIREVL